MSAETLSWLVKADQSRLFPKFWNASFFPSQLWDDMRPAERVPDAISITSMRHAWDKISWKARWQMKPPGGHADWRSHARAGRVAQG